MLFVNYCFCLYNKTSSPTNQPKTDISYLPAPAACAASHRRVSVSGLMQFLGQNSANSAAANAIMMQRLLGTGYELHPLGARKDNDPMAHVKVARSSKGWHCPQCIHISSTKGNLKSHILSGRHKSYTEKPFGCQYCDRSYGTKQSLQVSSASQPWPSPLQLFLWTFTLCLIQFNCP